MKKKFDHPKFILPDLSKTILQGEPPHIVITQKALNSKNRGYLPEFVDWEDQQNY